MVPQQNPCTFYCRDDKVSLTDLCSKPLKVGSRVVALSPLSRRIGVSVPLRVRPHKPHHFWFQVPCFSHQLGFVEELCFGSFIHLIEPRWDEAQCFKVLRISTLNNNLTTTPYFKSEIRIWEGDIVFFFLCLKW